MPPDPADLADAPAHVRAIVRDAVAVAAQTASRERDEALADRIGRAVIRELAVMLSTGRAPAPKGG